MLSQSVNNLENVDPAIDPIEETSNEQNGNLLSDASSLEEDEADGNVLEDEDDDDLEEQDIEDEDDEIESES